MIARPDRATRCPQRSRHARLMQAVLPCAVAACLALLSSCGGGGPGAKTVAANNGGGIGSGGTGSYTVGSISGFGSIVVNGVRYSYTSDQVSTGDGTSVNQLQFGMVVEIKGSAPSSDAKGVSSAKADAVRVSSELVGPVGAVDLASGTFTVMGQTVQTSLDTFYDSTNTTRLAQVGTSGCNVVRVYGFLRAQTPGGYNATRVECLARAPSIFRLRGAVDAVSGSTVTIGGTAFALASGLPTIRPSALIRAQVSQRSGSPAWTITDWEADARAVPRTGEARLEGVATNVAAQTAKTGTFLLNDTTVQTSESTNFENLTLESISATRCLSVRGSINQAGVLVATEVEIEGSYEGGYDDGKREGSRSIKLYGSASHVSEQTSSSFVFTVGGVPVTVNYSAEVIEEGTPADLRTASHIEIVGVRSANGSSITATSIELEDD
jgi:Domain of unknown function (DUF5666)